MSKAVLISIQPKWCELIANGKKTVEVRKTKPKLSTPFKVYIYCTKAKEFFSIGGGVYAAFDELYRLPSGEIKFGDSFELAADWAEKYDKDNFLNGKVIGEFVCDRIDEIRVVDTDLMRYATVNDKADMFISQKACLDVDDLFDYLWPKRGYGWHISDLVIYDKPKELGDFQKYGALSYDDWLYGIYNGTTTSVYEDYLKPFKVIHAPQSWCYVEELKI